MSEFKLFLKYLFSFRAFIDSLKEEVKIIFDLRRVFTLLLILSLGSLIFKKYLLAIFCLILAFIIESRRIYKAGEHNYWHKQQLKQMKDYNMTYEKEEMQELKQDKEFENGK